MTFLARTEGWITYDFPASVLANHKRARGFKGQKQVWFAYRFDGADSEVDLEAHHEIEFDRWRWALLAEAPKVVVSFKRAAYLKVAARLRPLCGLFPRDETHRHPRTRRLLRRLDLRALPGAVRAGRT